MGIIDEFTKALRPTKKAENTSYSAVVSKVDDEGVVWVYLAGSANETPTVSTASEIQKGDTVTVEWRNNKLHIVGNNSNPAVGAERVNRVARDATRANQVAAEAIKGAQIAANTNQYFWHTQSGTDTGAHITEIPRRQFLADPTNGGGNLLARSNGVAIRDGLDELAVFNATSLVLGASWNNALMFYSGSIPNVGTYGRIGLGSSQSNTVPLITLRSDNVLNLQSGGNSSYINLKPGGNAVGDIYVGANTTEFSGEIKVEGHSSSIGTIVNGTEVSNKNLAHETAKRLASISLPAGVWVVTGFVRFPSNANGVRRINISSTDNSASIDIQISASSNNTMQLETVKILQPSSTTTYYLNAWQNSNTSLTASDITLRAVRIA